MLTFETMTQPRRPPELHELKRSPHWHALEPIVAKGYDDARRGTWDNHHPNATLRWYAYEAGWDKGDDENQAQDRCRSKQSS